MIEDIQSVEVFVLLCETGSLQRVSELLSIDKSSASRKLAKLESKLGRRLFEHDKRPLVMTKDAKAIYPAARKLIEEKHQIESYYKRLQDDDSIVIRLMIGNAHIGFAPKIIDEYTKLFPQTAFNIISPTDVDDFIAGKADIISLSGQAEIPDTVMLPRGNMIFIPVASPAYIKQHGPIQHPDELIRHRVFSNLNKRRYEFGINFQLTKKGLTTSLNAPNSIQFYNVEMTHQAVIDGLGIALSLPLFLCIDDLEAGRLVPILNGWHRPSHVNYIACKKDDWKIRRLRNFADWYAKKLLAHEKECERRLVALYDRAFLLNLMH